MTSLKVSSPAELISAVPFLIGFHPADSLTVVAMRGPQITFAVRIDLPEPGLPEEEARAAVRHLASVVLQQQAEAVTIIGYGDEPRVTPALLRASHAFRRAGLTVVDELRVDKGRYWSYLCTDPACCPTEGRQCEPADSVTAAEATFLGAVALPSREDLAARILPAQGDDREVMIAATARAVLRLATLAGDSLSPDKPPETWVASDCVSEKPGLTAGILRTVQGRAGLPGGRAGSAPRRWSGSERNLGRLLWADLGIGAPSSRRSSSTRAVEEDRFFARARRAGREAVREAERCYRTGGRLSDDQAAWLGVLLLHTPIRDYAWTRTGTRDWEVALWSDLVRRVEPRYVPAPAALLAFVAWRAGQGPLASVAIERALTEKPDYSLAIVMREAILTGLPPSCLNGWPAVDSRPSPDQLLPDEDSDIASLARWAMSTATPGPTEGCAKTADPAAGEGRAGLNGPVAGGGRAENNGPAVEESQPRINGLVAGEGRAKANDQAAGADRTETVDPAAGHRTCSVQEPDCSVEDPGRSRRDRDRASPDHRPADPDRPAKRHRIPGRAAHRRRL